MTDERALTASMKVPPKRKGNLIAKCEKIAAAIRLNESPSQKEGKSLTLRSASYASWSLNESPSQKEGKSHC